MASSKTKFVLAFMALLYCIFQWKNMVTINQFGYEYDDSAMIQASKKDPSTTTTSSTTRDNNGSSGSNKYKFETIRLGDYVGDGVVSISFKVHLDPPPPSNNNKTSSDYIMKFTGNYNKFGEYYPDFANVGESVYRITSQILPSSPSVPQTIWYRKNISNPFRNGLFRLPTSIINETTGATGRPDLTSLQWRLLNSTRTSIAITECVKATHKHRNQKHILDIPYDKVPCFFRKLFEVLDFLHKHNIQWIDTQLWNIILQNGEIVIVDWHSALIVVDGNENNDDDHYNNNNNNERKEQQQQQSSSAVATNNKNIISSRSKNKSSNSSLPFGYVRLKEGEEVHRNDTITIAIRIREFLKITPQIVIDNDDGIGGLIDLEKSMSRPKNRNSMGWLIQHHKYFTSRQNESCNLTW